MAFSGIPPLSLTGLILAAFALSPASPALAGAAMAVRLMAIQGGLAVPSNDAAGCSWSPDEMDFAAVAFFR